MRLTLHHVPARQGQRWLVQGWQVFRRAPLALSALVATYLVAWLVMGLLGLLGAVLMLASLPLLSLVYMIATHQLLQNRPVAFAVWTLPFRVSRARTQSQLHIAFLYVLCTVALMALAGWVDGGQLDALQDALAQAGQSKEAAQAAEEALQTALGSGEFLAGMLLRLGGAVLISIPFWHAPALVHWGGHGALKSLFSSCVGIWANRSAFVINGLLWVVVLVGLSMALGGLMALLQSAAVAQLLLMPMLLLVSAVFYCGLYFTFVDCFRFAAEPT